MNEPCPQRPVLRWHGGKWMLAPWIIAHLPEHNVYVEPYGGAGSVLMRKPRSYAEIYNDLDDDVVGLFRVLQNQDQAARLRELLALTPFARTEFKRAYQETSDPVERARRLVIRCFMGFGSDGHNADVKTGFRANSNRSGTTPAHDWRNFPDSLEDIIDRLRGVTVECRPALKVMADHDRVGAVHYVDPPYLPASRSKKSRRGKIRYHAYRHEMTEEQHAELLEFLKTLQGAVVLSGYPSELYDDALRGWHREERAALADGARPRVEVLWMNEACCDRRGAGPLFAPAREAAE
jgi:DNA adenine methylase